MITVQRYGWLGEQESFYIDMDLLAFNLREFINGDAKSILGLSRFLNSHYHSDELGCLCLWSILEQIAQGLKFIHGKRELHRDIKPANGKLQILVLRIWLTYSTFLSL